ncbi:MAG: 50S ribosomal protein L9 [Magnetospiraceae bacterium]
MEVILLERIEKLGQMGDVVKVKTGYARNFLLPKKKALRATEANRKHFETQKAQLEADNLKRREEAEAVAAKMDDVSVVMVRQAGDSGQLYGSVNTRDIADAVTAAGFTIGRSQVRLEKPIKTLGLFDVAIALHPEVFRTVTVNVARSEEEAEIQAKTGQAMVGMDEEEDDLDAPTAEELLEPEALEALSAEDAEAAEDMAPATDEDRADTV